MTREKLHHHALAMYVSMALFIIVFWMEPDPADTRLRLFHAWLNMYLCARYILSAWQYAHPRPNADVKVENKSHDRELPSNSGVTGRTCNNCGDQLSKPYFTRMPETTYKVTRYCLSCANSAPYWAFSRHD